MIEIIDIFLLKSKNFLKKFVPQSLFSRFICIIILPVLIGQIALIFLFYDRHWYNVSHYTSNIIVQEIKALIELHDTKTNDNLSGNYLNLKYQFLPNEVISTKYKKRSEELEIFRNILSIKIDYPNIVKLSRSKEIEVLLQLQNGVMQVSFPSKILINPTVYIFISWLIFLTIILLTISLLFSKNQIKSILLLTDAADKFGSNDNTQPLVFKPSGAKEIRKAGIAFLRMKERIEQQISKRTQMLAMISHDLRTPLTRMKLQVELMEDSEETEYLKQDINAMQSMIASYLDFATGECAEEFQTIKISVFLTEFIKKWPNFEINLVIHTKYDRIRVKPLSFERAISNIIANAMRYATMANISVYSNKHNFTIDIEDNGSGIKETEKTFVFKPFYRTEKSRTLDNSSNVGLGLAISMEIIHDHSGNIVLIDSKALGGLLVRITLPTNLQ